jgi:hypothetical protein
MACFCPPSLNLGSSHGVVIDPPLHRYWRLVSTPSVSAAPKSCRLPVSGETCSWRGATFGPELPPSGLVPPLPFLPAATVFSTWHFSGLLHPETDHGVHQVSGFRHPFARPDPSSVQPKSLAARVSSPALTRGPTPTVPRRLPPRSSEDERTDILCDEASWRCPPTIPAGAPPFEAFPSLSADPRQPRPVSAHLPSACSRETRVHMDIQRVVRPQRCGTPRTLPSRRWLQVTMRLVALQAEQHVAGPVSPTSRP